MTLMKGRLQTSVIDMKERGRGKAHERKKKDIHEGRGVVLQRQKNVITQEEKTG